MVPGMEEPWYKAVALRLKVVTRRETNGRRDKEITEVTVTPMFGPEYRHHAKRITIIPQNYQGDDRLELAPFPAKAELEPTSRYYRNLLEKRQ